VRVDARPRLVVVDVRRQKCLERRRRDTRREMLPQLLFGRIDEVDPSRKVTHARRLRGRSDD